MVIRTLLWMAVLSLTLNARSARAESAVVMALGGDASVATEEWTRATVAVADEVQARGIALPPGQVVLRSTDVAGCSEDECLRAERERRGVDVLVTVSLFAAHRGTNAAATVVVSVVGAEHATASESAITESLPIEDAARRAYGMARGRFDRGASPWLMVRGSPAGAMVLIDDAEVGVLPWEGPLSAGSHRLEVRLAGRSAVRDVVVSGGDPVEVSISLDVIDEGASAAWNWTLAGSLVGASIGLAIPALVTAGSVGRCTDTGPMGCSEWVQFGDASIALSVASALALASGVVIALTQPIRVWVSASPASAAMSARFSF